MKIILLLFILFTTKSTQAITVPYTPKNYSVLQVTKGNNTKFFQLNKGIKVWYKDGEVTTKVKGFLTNITSDSITITSFRKKNAKQQTVAISSIMAMSKIDVKAKRTMYTILGIALLLAIPAAFAVAASTSTLSYIYILPSAITIGILEYTIPVLYIIQSITKLKIENGWKIIVQ